MKKLSKYILLFCLFCFTVSISISQEVSFYDEINTKSDDYGVSFRTVPDGIEIWVTSSEGANNPRSRKLKRFLYKVENFRNTDRYIFSKTENLAQPINSPLPDKDKVVLDGSAAFAFCDNYGLFVSNRNDISGKFKDNDIYEIYFNDDGTFNVNRADALCSDYWDDTPTLSSDGKIVCFASDRMNPGTGKTDLFVSYRKNNVWTAPEILSISTSEFSEQTPYLSPEGYLYFSSNQTKDNDYDIFKIKVDLSTGMPVQGATAEPIDISGVNQQGSNESHPGFSPGNSWFVFSSDKEYNGRRDLNVYSVLNDKNSAKKEKNFDLFGLNLSIITRTVNQDKSYQDAVDPLQTSVYVYDIRSNEKYQSKSDSKGKVSFDLKRKAGDKPTDDGRFRKLIVWADVPSPRFVSPIDTIVFDIFCNKILEHSLTLVDTAIYYNPECRQDFPVERIQFFIRGYWCPTTFQFKDKTPCATLFQDECLDIEFEEPKLPCTGNDLYSYKLDFKKPVVNRMRKANLCIDSKDAQKAKQYAVEVDSAIHKFVDIMKSALENQCVLKALQRRERVTVEVVGWTDPGSLHEDCRYTGSDINLNDTSIIQINGYLNKPYLQKSSFFIKNGSRFVTSRYQGNEMLADLRAYYTALLLDEVWKEKVTAYRNARNENLIKLVATGGGVDMESNRSFAEKRAVNVRIEVPITEKQKLKQNRPDPGRLFDLSVDCGESPCKPKSYYAGDQAIIKQTEYKVPDTDPVNSEVKTESYSTEPKPLAFIPESNGTKGNCHTILFISSPNRQDAEPILNALKRNDIDASMELYIDDEANTQNYRVKFGCWKTKQDAKTALEFISNKTRNDVLLKSLSPFIQK